MKKNRNQILCALLVVFGIAAAGCTQGADDTKLNAQLVSGSQPEAYAVRNILFLSEVDSGRSMDGNNEALSAFLTVNPDGSLSLEAQTPECPSSGSPSACTGENAPQSFQGAWKKLSGSQYEINLQIPKDRNSRIFQPMILELDAQAAGRSFTLAGKQTGGTSRIHIRGFDPNDRPSGMVSQITFQKLAKTPTVADLAGKYTIVPQESKSFSNADSSLNKPLLDTGVTQAEVNLNADGTFSVDIVGGTGHGPAPGTWQIVDRNHLKVISGTKTMNFTFRFLEDEKKLTLWNYNDQNSYGTGTDVSSTVMVNLLKR